MKWRDLFWKKSKTPPPPPEEDDNFVLDPPSVDRVKARLMVQCASWLRSGWEIGVSEELPTPLQLCAWVTRLSPEATDQEIDLHALPIGEWPERAVRDASWAQQSGGMLEWALYLREDLPAWDQRFDWTDVVVQDFQTFPTPDSWQPFLTLRSHDEIEREAMVMETCSWRMRTGQILGGNEKAYAHKLLGRSAQLGHVPLAPDGDLLCSDGRSLADQSPEEFDLVRSIAREKLQALNWLTGQDEEYHSVTCDTIVGWLWAGAWEGKE